MLDPFDLRLRTSISIMERPLNVAAWTALVLLACYMLCKCIYNLYLHPLSKFPGSKLAALGGLYEFYYDVIKDGLYLWEIERMHREYGKGPNTHHLKLSQARTDSVTKGPIVRVNARELHVRDSQYYATIYAGGSRKVNKDAVIVAANGFPSSALSTVDHELHRARRGYLSPLFSKRSIIGLESIIHERLSRLCMRLEEAMHQGQAVCLDSAFSALTADIITLRFYGEHFDYLGIKDFECVVTKAFQGSSRFVNIARFFPGPVACLKSLPIPILRLIEPNVADLLTLREEIKQKLLTSPNKESTAEAKSKSFIVETLVDPNIPAEERRIDRLLDEAFVTIFAGTETTSRALSVTMFYLLNNKSHVNKLCDELDTLPLSKDDAYSLSQLEPLPFLVSFPASQCWLGTKIHLKYNTDRRYQRRSSTFIWFCRPSSKSGDS